MRHRGSADVAGWLVRHAAHRSPPDLAPRLEEEWLADLSARRGLTSRLRFGLGCCWAGRIIAHEHGAACAAAAGAAPGHRLLLVHVRFDPSRWSRKTTVVIAVLCIHVVLIYAFVTGLATHVVAIISSPLIISATQKLQPHEPPPPLPPPRFAPPRINDPAPVSPFDIPDAPAGIHDGPPPTQHPSISAAPSIPPVVTRVRGGPGAGFPNTDDYYPAVARRLGEAGTTIVQVCVDASGRLTASPSMVRSSGSARIDAGALNLATAGSGHYRPTTENGRPVSSCYPFLVTFRFRD